ncbi:MAG: matrixin family metalloprotease [Bifidobacteriaceae bacterium]|jgi:hypothetical protein|nr:matrixin family metalloprotease [Bifidobacteriaceae bacterium]
MRPITSIAATRPLSKSAVRAVVAVTALALAGASLCLGASEATAAPVEGAACATKSSTQTLAAVAEGINATSCQAVGDYVEIDSSGGFYIPKAGEGTAVTATMADGSAVAIEVFTSTAGDVSLSVSGPSDSAVVKKAGAARDAARKKGQRWQGGSERPINVNSGAQKSSASTGQSVAAAVTRCSSSTYSTLKGKWHHNPYLIVNTSEGLPSGVKGSAFLQIARDSMNTWVNVTDACSVADSMTRTATIYENNYSNSNINGANNACASSSDGFHVVDFGNLTGGTVGLACSRYVWVLGWRTNEVDVRLDNSSRSWVTSTSGCTGSKYDVRSVLTHELGHFWGLADQYASSTSQLTMYGYSSTCSTTQRTLGKGDALGINALY